MDAIPWVLVMVGIAALVVALAVIMAWKYRKGRLQQKSEDYKMYFIMGLVWMAVGIPLMIASDFSMSWMFVMGVIFLAIGLANRDKWGKESPVSPGYRKKLLIATFVGVAILVVGMVALLLIG